MKVRKVNGTDRKKMEIGAQADDFEILEQMQISFDNLNLSLSPVLLENNDG